VVEIKMENTEKGQWFTVRDGARDGPFTILAAHRAGDTAEMFTVYWRGRTDFGKLDDLFSISPLIPTEPTRSGETLIRVSIFTEHDKLSFDLLDPWMPSKDRGLRSRFSSGIKKDRRRDFLRAA
jgi:hypothetical protein